MSRPGRQSGPLKGRTAEANDLAQFLRDLTAGQTVSQLQERHGVSRTVWSEYRSGQKIIPLSRLKQIIEDRFARDARTRDQKLQEGRSLYAAAMTAAAAATAPPASVTAAPETKPARATSVSPAAEEAPGSDPEQNPDDPLAGEAAELSTDNPLTSTDDGPRPAADISPEPESKPGPQAPVPVVSRSLPGPGPRLRGRAERYDRWRTPAQWAALAVLVAVLVIANRTDHAKDPSAEASPPQSLGQESPGPEETPSPTAPETPEASATPTPSAPEPAPSEGSGRPSAKPEPPAAPSSAAPGPAKSKAPQPAPPPPAVGAGPRTFVNAGTQMCLEIRRSAGHDGATANQWTCNNSSSQKWIITNPTGETNLVSMDSRKCLEIRGDVGDDGATANQWSCNNVPSSQVWRFQPAASGGWQIVGAYSGKCLTIRGQGDGALATQQPCDGTPTQTWH
ncbi:RICIN domain-containing protein [Streptomyces xanthophaeus]|uniref:RICIN domain-containing protein n=1 Tax=Streptomyces xanthophaeus TaxID=67385 RepID=UPI003717B160